MKLGAAFAGVIGLMAIALSLSWLAVNELDSSLSVTTEQVLPATQIARELEINTYESALAVSKYLLLRDPAQRQRFEDERSEFAEFSGQFLALTTTDEVRRLAQEAERIYARFTAQGLRLMAAKDRQWSSSVEIFTDIAALDLLLAQGAASSEEPGIDSVRLRRELADLRYSLSEYLRSPGALIRQEVGGEARDTRLFFSDIIARFEALLQLAVRDVYSGPGHELLKDLEQIVSATQEIDQTLPAFSATRREMDDILDEEIQTLVDDRLHGAQEGLHSRVEGALVKLLALALTIVIGAAVAVRVLSNGIRTPLRRLVEGAERIGQSQADWRIELPNRDEFGQLADAFNRMAERLADKHRELEEANLGLEETVIERTANLRATNIRLEAELATRRALEDRLVQTHKMESLGTLAGGIAHDFNNMLAVMLGCVELAQDDVETGSVAHQNLDHVQQAGRRSRDLVKQILAFSRQDPVHRVPLDMAAFVEDALPLLRATLPTTITIRTDIAPDCGRVMGDPTQLHQVLMNLGSNAADAIGRETGVLTLTARRVEPGTTPPDSNVPLSDRSCIELTVADTGAGMPPEILTRAFDPFFTTKKPGAGTGMGLAVIHGIVSGHDGDVTLSSEPGRGTTVTVRLPLCAHADTSNRAHRNDAGAAAPGPQLHLVHSKL